MLTYNKISVKFCADSCDDSLFCFSMEEICNRKVCSGKWQYRKWNGLKMKADGKTIQGHMGVSGALWGKKLVGQIKVSL